ncbi:PadR family transcriptional regulator [Deinococcus humi]|uniref:DNA-binding PadR family transcriptional regulator n=1 Tax=Deinococcus humi TaxID=662880 RepID=A0A7W8K1C2_9DEIO|nr:PadR family transcriptional regulator [Deinococcus humi]MBB5365778.1 DNA-binding PadR family transcriptional regulator [Deinococcus humi]GGO41077.1 PadR family transcriptional regulator [Deinococcus humi]
MDQNTLRGHLDLILLASLKDAPLYGVQLIQHVHALTAGHFHFKEGTLYPALHRLEKQGLLMADLQPSPTGGPPRKYYHLTPAGRTDLARRQQAWQAFSAAMQPFGGQA